MKTRPTGEALCELRFRLNRIESLIEKIHQKLPAPHLQDHNMERYYLGMVTDEAELERIEMHLLCCTPCVKRTVKIEDYINAFRVAISIYESRPGRYSLPKRKAPKLKVARGFV